MMDNMNLMDPGDVLNEYGIDYQQQQMAQGLTKQRVMDYLDDPAKYTCGIVMRYPLAIQRSYTSERRVAHPKTHVALTGNGWERYKHDLCRQHFDGLNSGSVDGGCELVGSISIPTSTVKEERIQNKILSSDCLSSRQGPFFADVFTDLHTKTQSKKLAFQLSFGVRCGLNQSKAVHFGNLRSEVMTVFSKPSKRRQTKSCDFDPNAIRSGDLVALHRASPQGKLCMYLDPRTNSFRPNTRNWSLFEIHVIDQNTKTDPVAFEPINATVRYGNFVKLVEVDSGKTFSLLRIRGFTDPVAKKNKTLEDEKKRMTASYSQNMDEPVSLCQNCAFEYVFSAPGKYLSSTRDSLMIEDALEMADEFHHVVEAACKWTIVTVTRQETVFAPLMGAPVLPVAPFPVIVTADAHRDLKTGGYIGEFTGEHFRKDLCLYFGTVRISPFQVSSISLFFVLPDYDTCCEEPYVVLAQKSNKMVSEILFVRESDGVVYPTQVYFQHSSDQIRLGSFISSEDLVGDELMRVYRSDPSSSSDVSTTTLSTTTSNNSCDVTSDLSHSDTCGSGVFIQSNEYLYTDNYGYSYNI